MISTLLSKNAKPLTRLAPPQERPVNPTESELLFRVGQKKDRVAFEKLYECVSTRALSLATRLAGNRTLAEEAFQEGMLKVWLQAKTYRPEGNAMGWILRIIQRECLKLLRNESKKKVAHTKAIGSKMDSTSNPEDSAEARETRDTLARTLRALPASQRNCIRLCVLLGLSQAAAGELIALPQTTVSFKLTSGLQRLRVALMG